VGWGYSWLVTPAIGQRLVGCFCALSVPCKGREAEGSGINDGPRFPCMLLEDGLPVSEGRSIGVTKSSA
jgi:hypothetical protein